MGFVQVGTSLYAVSNVLQEKLVKQADREEYLGMLGAFGCVFAACQLLAMETDALHRTEWSSRTVGFVVGFVVCLNLMYTRASLFLKDCDAALLNLSLLTSDVYAVIFSFFCYGYLVSWLYFVAFGLTSLGLAVYSTAGSPTPPAFGDSNIIIDNNNPNGPHKEGGNITTGCGDINPVFLPYSDRHTPSVPSYASHESGGGNAMLFQASSPSPSCSPSAGRQRGGGYGLVYGGEEQAYHSLPPTSVPADDPILLPDYK